jgi:transcription termination factor Rho
VPPQLGQRFGLRQGCYVTGRGLKFPGNPGPKLDFVETVDGQVPGPKQSRAGFKKLLVIDPDFHYELGTFKQEGQLSMRVVDLLCPIGRGQRGLIVAPPRTGKTTILMNIAAAMENLYPDVHLIVLLADERPEEGTAWKRSVHRGEVYVSTMDEAPEHHTRLAELVQARAERLVETGKEVMILLDSITRLTRAYNNLLGGKNARTMSGGLDARVFQQPKHFFGAARNTENGGSLTILATTLIDTGSKMDQVIFEEFKGTGNMELTLDRRLADRRVFPAIDIERTGTRKEERLLGRATLKKVDILRRVLSRLKPREAMEMLIDRLGRYPSNQDFLNAFSLDDVQ